MRNILLTFFLLVLVATTQAQTSESIGYYYQGKKMYFPVSYDRIVVGLKPGNSFIKLKNTIASSMGVETDSLSETFAGKQILIKNGRNKEEDIALKLSKLKKLSGLSFARPVFKSRSGKYCSYGEEFIVDLKATSTFVTLQVLLQKNGCTLVRKYPFQDDIYILAAGEQNDYDGLKMANLFYETGLFDYAEPNKMVYDAQHTAPNDPLYNLQWAHKNAGSAAQYYGTPGADMKVQEAWAITMGSPTIKIGVIDEGVDLTHPDLQGNLLQGFNGATMTSNPGDGAPLFSIRAHGTNCAGIIAAKANNGIGVAGIAPNCKIIPAVIFGGSGVDEIYLGDAAVAACFDYVRINGADVISNSWGGGSESSTIDAAIRRAVTLGRGGKGCVVLVSSGNDNGAVSYPASNPDVIAVGGINMCNQRKSPSSCDGEGWGANYGTGLDVVAPCVKIATTDNQGAGGYNTAAGVAGDYFNTFNGTSSACPNAAGVVALMLSLNNTLTADSITSLLERSCDKVPGYVFSQTPAQPNGTWNNSLGHGRVNALAALQLLASCSVPEITSVDISHPVCSAPASGSIVIKATGSNNLEYSINDGISWFTSNTFNNLPSGDYNIKVKTQGATPNCFSIYWGNPVRILPANTAISTVSYEGPAVVIPDGDAAGVNIPLTISGLGNILVDVNFMLNSGPSGTCDATVGNTSAAVDHTDASDLVFQLTSPGGKTITLINRVGPTGSNNFCNLLLDDQGGYPFLENAIGSPINGNFLPTNPLSAFNGENPNGTWTLNISDRLQQDIGSLRRFSLILSSTNSTPGPCLNVNEFGGFNAFISCNGAASAQQKITVQGTSLVGSVIVSAPTGFQISKTFGSGFGSAVSLDPVSGTVSTTTLYVRMAANAAGPIVGNVTCTSSGAITQQLRVSGSINENTVWYVNKTANGLGNGTSWVNAFTTLQDALEAARTCDQVKQLWVAGGIYYPDEGKLNTNNNNNETFQLRDGLEIYGGFAGTEATLSARNLSLGNASILSGEIQQDGNKFNNTNNVVLAENLSSFAVLDGFTIRDGYSNIILPALKSKGTGLLVINGTSPIFRNLIIQNNEGPYGAGVTTIGNSPFFINCIVAGNRTNFANGAVWNDNASPAYYFCSMANNAITGGSDFVVMRNSGTSSPNIRNSIIWGVGTAVAGATPSINYSIIQNPSVWPGTGNSNADPLFINEGTGNLRLKPCSPAINTGGPLIFGSTDIVGTARPVGASPDMGAYELPTAPVLYVNADAAAGGDGSSWAAALRSLQDALQVQYCTAIREIWVAKGAYLPTPTTNRDLAFVMKNNLTIYGGFAGAETAVGQRNLNLNPTILSGDIGVVNNNSDNSFNIIRNDGNGLNNTAILDGFIITGGNANKGTYVGNRGGGAININSAPSYFNCAFSGNNAVEYGGGMFNQNLAPLVVNSVFAGNRALYGGGLYNESASTNVVNSTFAGNLATAEGGAISTYGAVVPQITNSILWGNSSGIRNAGGAAPAVSYSIVQGDNAGTGNLNVDPAFMLQPLPALGSLGDLRLLACSPAINVGSNAGLPGGVTTDLRGSLRIANTTVDMGAYERQSLALPSTIYVDANATGNNDGSSWANSYTSLMAASRDLNLCATGNLFLLIATGTYIAPVATSFSFDKLNVVIQGGYPTGGGPRNVANNPVIIKGDVRVLKSLRISGVRVEKQ